MRRTLENLGLGTDLIDPAAPVRDGEPSGRMCRQLALWVLSQAHSGHPRMPAVAAVFRHAIDPPAGSYDVLVRQLLLLRRLVELELPLLGRRLRVDTKYVGEWMQEPRGGRVDALTTVRANPVGPPESWLVRRVERDVDTPVNRLVAAILRRAEHHVVHLAGLYRVRRLSVPERVDTAGTALRRFLREHPLGRLEVPPGVQPEQYERDSRRRPGELARVASLLDWWRNSREVDLAKLQEVLDGADAVEMTAHAAYELSVVLGLLYALAVPLRFDRTEDPAASLTFHGRRGTAVLRINPADLFAPGVPGPTAALEITAEGAPPTTLLIMVRNISGMKTWPYLTTLWKACQDGQTRRSGLLITPDPAPFTDKDVQLQVIPPTLNAPALVERWLQLLEPHLRALQPYR